jgi:hypothetical protein
MGTGLTIRTSHKPAFTFRFKVMKVSVNEGMKKHFENHGG